MNTQLLEEHQSQKKILLLLANLKEIKYVEILTKYHSLKRITLLHCISEYPTSFENSNLNSINFLKKKFRVEVGLSDHSLDIEVPIAAVAMGVTVIEKHFTLSKKMKGPDHKASLEPKEFKQMVSKIRNIEKAIGRFEKTN